MSKLVHISTHTHYTFNGRRKNFQIFACHADSQNNGCRTYFHGQMNVHAKRAIACYQLHQKDQAGRVNQVSEEGSLHKNFREL
jgi:hypothetical protein